jgi:diguanylate cyclase (GGDEF)-like protein
MRNPSQQRSFFLHSLAFRLYGILAVAILSIVILAFAGMHFAQVTAVAAHRLSSAGIDGIVKASELGILIEQHRRIVEAAPVEVDRTQIANSRASLQRIELRISELCQHKSEAAARLVAARLPELTAEAIIVLALAENLAQDKALDAVEKYQVTARAVQSAVHDIRTRQIAAADQMVGLLNQNARSLQHWGTAAVLIAITILAPASLLILGHAARRMKSLWRSMHRLAHNDTSQPVPSLADIDEIGDMARAVQVFKDNAVALARQRGEIEQINGWLDIAMQNMARGLSMFDADHRLVLCNDSYRTMYNLPAALTVRGTEASQIFAHRADQTAKTEIVAADGRSQATSVQALARDRSPRSARQTLADGRIIAIAVQPLERGGWVAVHQDVTKQREAEAKIARLARQDALTGLSNRLMFREELERRCATGNAAMPPFALMIVDLDHFKQINDTFGHPAGDAVLEAVAQRLRALTRSGDIVARLGGDEFAILQDGAVSPDTSRRMAERIIAGLSAPYTIEGTTASIGASIGIASAPADATTASHLFSHADLALYHSKAQGRGSATIFAPALQDAALAERTLARELHDALTRGEFELFYQPILDLQTQQVASCEALLRWRHPTRGLIQPLQFIPFAETSGLIVPIGRWALTQACRDATQWPDHVAVAVNLSAIQVLSGTLLDDIQTSLASTGLAARRLELEVTESLLLDDQPLTRKTLLEIRGIGVKIALDDFGTGYASLSYLRRFPFDKLKIDQTFVRDLPDHAECVAIVRAVASLARSLNMISVAEGVETADHLARVTAAGCSQVQGYLFSRPVPAQDLAQVFQTCLVRLVA